jgi:hypothetical protein
MQILSYSGTIKRKNVPKRRLHENTRAAGGRPEGPSVSGGIKRISALGKVVAFDTPAIPIGSFVSQ